MIPAGNPPAAPPAGPDLHALGDRLQLALGPRYEVLRPVALGGMAALFQLEHRLHRGLFIAKVLQPHLAERPELVASFRVEATHAGQLTGHPGIVPVFDFAEWDGLFYMLMPFIEGEDLDHLLTRAGKLRRAEALTMVAQISSTLAHAERHGITHGDVSPGNIRLDAFGQYKLLDFGLSRSEASAGSKVLGSTPAYTSPEQIRGETPDGRSDIYALGITLFEALAGERPFQAATLAELEQKHLRGDYTLPQDVAHDPTVTALLKNMLATDPDQRIGSAFELSGILAALGYEQPLFRNRPTVEFAAAPTRQSRKRRLSDAGL